MKINEIVLVTENWKGTEKNCLMTAADYLRYVDLDRFDSRKDVADTMMELGRTLGDENAWSENYFAANVTVSARFCTDDRQLTRFLAGFYNSTDQQVLFDKSMCSGECLDKLSELGMDTKGKVSIGSLSYTELYSAFEQGKYSAILMGGITVSWKNCRLRICCCRMSCQEILLWQLGYSYLQDIPVEQRQKEENCLIGIEWGHGVYLSSTPSAIDFRHIRQEYGTERKIEGIYQYREMLQDRFRLYSRMETDELISDKVREAVMYANFEEFGTSDFDQFRKDLNEGRYDKGFAEMVEKQKEKSR